MIRLWDARTGKHKHKFELENPSFSSIAFAPDGAVLAIGTGLNIGEESPQHLELWDARTWERKKVLVHRHWVTSVAFSPDGETLASGGRGLGGVRLWDAYTGKHKQFLIGHKSEVNSLAFSPDGTTLASGSDDDTILLWDLTSVDDVGTER